MLKLSAIFYFLWGRKRGGVNLFISSKGWGCNLLLIHQFNPLLKDMFWPFPQVWADTAHTSSSPPPLSPSYSRNAAKSTRDIIMLHNYYLYSQFSLSAQSQYLKMTSTIYLRLLTKHFSHWIIRPSSLKIPHTQRITSSSSSSNPSARQFNGSLIHYKLQHLIFTLKTMFFYFRKIWRLMKNQKKDLVATLTNCLCLCGLPV